MSSDQTSKDARRTALAKTLETVRARREALARETSATRRAVEAAAADKAEGSDAVELPRAARLAALRDAAARKRKAPAEDGTRRIRVTRDARGDEQLELCGAPAEGASSGAHASPRPSYFGWFTLEGNGRNEKKVFGRPRKNNHARRTSCPRRARGERGPQNAAAESSPAIR